MISTHPTHTVTYNTTVQYTHAIHTYNTHIQYSYYKYTHNIYIYIHR